MRLSILKMLENCPEISGEKIARELKISRTAVHKHIGVLRSKGYNIESSPRRGYRYHREQKPFSDEAIRLCLEDDFWDVRYFKELDSTNTRAKALAEAGCKEGLAVIADAQTCGSGRLGRSWHTSEGEAVNLSVLLRPKCSLRQAPGLTLMAGLAVAEALEIFGIETKIKWPNDVLAQNRKIAGILSEMQAETDSIDWVIIGMGININQNSFPSPLCATAVSACQVLGRPLDRADVAASVLKRVRSLYAEFLEGHFALIRESWLQRAAGIGEEVLIKTDKNKEGQISGQFLGIDQSGYLLLKTKEHDRLQVFGGELLIEAEHE